MKITRSDITRSQADLRIVQDDVSEQPTPTAVARSARSNRALARLERDRARGYSINTKQVVLAFAVEFWIIGLIIAGTYLLIAESASDRVSREEVFSALLLPAALAMVELARVPLAIAVRTQEAWRIKVLAAVGVAAAITVTSFSLSQIAWKTFDIRIAEATRASDNLAAARAKKDAFDRTVAQSNREIAQLTDKRNKKNEEVAALREKITQLKSASGTVCKPILGADGQPVLDNEGKPKQNCNVPIAIVSQAQLNSLNAQIASAKKELDAAEADLKHMSSETKTTNPTIDQEVLKAEQEYRAAVNKSQLHSYTGMVTGKAVADVTEAEVKNLEKYLIIIPSIAAAFASTLIAVTAVRRIKPLEPSVTVPDEAVAYLFGPLVSALRTEANDAVAAAVNNRTRGSAPQPDAKVASL